MSWNKASILIKAFILTHICVLSSFCRNGKKEDSTCRKCKPRRYYKIRAHRSRYKRHTFRKENKKIEEKVKEKGRDSKRRYIDRKSSSKSIWNYWNVIWLNLFKTLSIESYFWGHNRGSGGMTPFNFSIVRKM